VSIPTKSKLDILLAEQPAGTWVVLDASMSKILGAANTPDEAMEQAHIPNGMSGGPGSKRPVMLQIPDPTMACFF
jgi:hypothetical protein